MEYRCVATSVEGFVQQLAVAYVTHGYWFYVQGQIPEHKGPAAVDQKLMDRYGIAISKWTRARRKRQGLANMQYLRHERTFVLLATKGRHDFFERERPAIRDIRRMPIKFAGYSIGCGRGRDGRWHASVRVDRQTYRDIRDYMVDRGVRVEAPVLADSLQRVGLSPYAPVRRQLLNVWRAVNRARRAAGLGRVPVEAVPLRRATVRVFEKGRGDVPMPGAVSASVGS